MASPLDQRRIWKLIDNDASVSENYQRLIMQTIDGVYDDELPDDMTRIELRDRIIGEVRQTLAGVFPDLTLSGVGGIGAVSGSVGTFYFTKGSSTGFLYKNLSAGEKAVFDLLLDLIIKRDYYDDSIWCIDEPETHLNTRVQGAVLEALLANLPTKCQLFLASHSIGFMRKAWELAQSTPDEVCFIDMQGVDFDSPVVVEPVRPTRQFWSSTLDVALGDMAGLVAPEHLVLCEGRPAKGATDNKAAFDASCYQRIFMAEFPNTDFVSVGNSDDVSNDRLEFGFTFQTLVTSTSLTRVVDRDMRSDVEVQELQAAGTRVLSRRHLEAYLLDDEVVSSLCTALGQPDKITEALIIRQEELEASVSRGNDPDDYKSAAGSMYVRLRKLLGITTGGSTWHAFARDTLAPLIQPGTAVYAVLRTDLFGKEKADRGSM